MAALTRTDLLSICSTPEIRATPWRKHWKVRRVLIVQVGQRTGGLFNDEPHNALTLALEPVANGIRVTMGEQQWYRDQGGRIMIGGLIGFLPFFFTWPLGSGRDEPVDSQLWVEVWESIESYTRQYDASPGETRQFPQRSGVRKCHAERRLALARAEHPNSCAALSVQVDRLLFSVLTLPRRRRRPVR
jgi:hypothetical protein